LARTASPLLCEGEAGVRPRLYCRGEQPIVLLKARAVQCSIVSPFSNGV
jgi:hypothetical protein